MPVTLEELQQQLKEKEEELEALKASTKKEEIEAKEQETSKEKSQNELLIEQNKINSELEKRALEQDEATDAMFMLTANVKSIDGIDVGSYVKEVGRGKSGIEAAKAYYVGMIKAVAVANDGINKEELEKIEKELEVLSFDAIKLKAQMLDEKLKLSSKGKADAKAMLNKDENPLIKILQDKQYKR